MDDVTRGREQFLKIYKEEPKSTAAEEDDVAPKEIKLYRDEEGDLEESSGRLLKLSANEGGNGKPLIQEIKSTNATATEVPAKVEEVKQSSEPVQEFNWDTAERVDAEYKFFHMKEFVILNFQMKGYCKISDVHHALSENELLIEIREPLKNGNGKQRVHRLCKTLFKEVDVDQSSVELLVDFIAVKLKKSDKDHSWDQVGYDIKDFTLPKRGQVKSNFLTYTPPAPEPKNTIVATSESTDDKENTVTNR